MVTISLEKSQGVSSHGEKLPKAGRGRQGPGGRRRQGERSGELGGGGRLSHSPWRGRAAPA